MEAEKLKAKQIQEAKRELENIQRMKASHFGKSFSFEGKTRRQRNYFSKELKIKQTSRAVGSHMPPLGASGLGQSGLRKESLENSRAERDKHQMMRSGNKRAKGNRDERTKEIKENESQFDLELRKIIDEEETKLQSSKGHLVGPINIGFSEFDQEFRVFPFHSKLIIPSIFT